MYGEYVHRAVIENREMNRESQFILSMNHMIKENYFQARCKVDPSDTPTTLAQKIHALEYQHYPKIIEDIVIKLPEFLVNSTGEA